MYESLDLDLALVGFVWGVAVGIMVSGIFFSLLVCA